MAKVSGLPTTVSVGGATISGDVGSLTLSTPYGVQDITGVNASALERLLLRADAQLTLNCFFNATAGASHASLKTPGTKAVVIVFANGAATATFTCVQTDCTWDLGADGALTMSAPLQLSNGTAVAWT
jgi:hypothetical protein